MTVCTSCSPDKNYVAYYFALFSFYSIVMRRYLLFPEAEFQHCSRHLIQDPGTFRWSIKQDICLGERWEELGFSWFRISDTLFAALLCIRLLYLIFCWTTKTLSNHPACIHFSPLCPCTCLCLQVCSSCACLQLRWIPSTVRERLCHLTTSWIRPGSLCLGIYPPKYTTDTAPLFNILWILTHELSVFVFVSFPPASASYILLQFAQYGNILKHTVRHTQSSVQWSVMLETSTAVIFY